MWHLLVLLIAGLWYATCGGMGQWGGFANTPHRMAGMPQILCLITTEGQGLSGRSGVLATPVSCRSESFACPCYSVAVPVSDTRCILCIVG